MIRIRFRLHTAEHASVVELDLSIGSTRCSCRRCNPNSLRARAAENLTERAGRPCVIVQCFKKVEISVVVNPDCLCAGWYGTAVCCEISNVWTTGGTTNNRESGKSANRDVADNVD